MAKYNTSDFALYMNLNMESGSATWSDDLFVYMNTYVSSLSITIPWNNKADGAEYCYMDEVQYATANIVLSNASRLLRMSAYNDAFSSAYFGRYVDLPQLLCNRYEFYIQMMFQGFEEIKTYRLLIKACTFDMEKDQLVFDCEADRFYVYPVDGTYHILTNEINQQKAQTTISHFKTGTEAGTGGAPDRDYGVPNEKNVTFATAHTVTDDGIDINPHMPIGWETGTMCTTGTSYFNSSSYTKKIEHFIRSITINWNANVWGEISYEYFNRTFVVASGN